MLTLKVVKYGSLTSLLMTALHFTSHAYLYAESRLLEQFKNTRDALVADVATTFGYERPKPSMPELDALALAEREALRYGINPTLVKSLIQVESANKQFAVSPAGALGRLQIMPANTKRCGLKHYGELFDDEKNIKCGVQILSEELKATNYDMVKALRRYNGGPNCSSGGCKESEGHWQAVLKHMAKDVSFSAPVSTCHVDDNDRQQLDNLMETL